MAAKKRVVKKAETPPKSVDPTPGIEKKVDRKKLIIGLVTAAVVALLAFGLQYLYTRYLVAAYVNGEQISRLEVIQKLEKQGGKNILNQLVTQKLIIQEARKRNISVSKEEYDNEVKAIEANVAQQGMTLDQALEAQGMTRAQLNEQINIQVLVKKMVKTPVVTDKEVDEYIEKNKEQMTPEQMEEAGFRDSIKQQLLSQKQQQGVETLITDLEKNAKITTVTQY